MNIKKSIVTPIAISFLLVISINQVSAEENKVENKAKTEITKKACLTYAQLKRPAQEVFSKCVKNTYNKARCSKKVNLCIKR